MQPGKTRLVMLESPTNPRMGICDLKALCAIAREVRHDSWPCIVLVCHGRGMTGCLQHVRCRTLIASP